MTTYRALLLVLVSIVFGGCVTYINIPAQRGDFAGHNPNHITVQHVLIEALRKVVKEHPLEGKFALLLPDETTAQTYATVASKVSKQAVWPGNLERSELPILQVKQIHIRGQDAHVDILYPRSLEDTPDTPKLMTITLRWHPLKGWLPVRLRVWRVPPEDAQWTAIEDLGEE